MVIKTTLVILKEEGKMKRTKLLAFLTFVMILILIGCTQRVIDFTLISTKNVDLSKAQNFT
jgi:hypothetical protein